MQLKNRLNFLVAQKRMLRNTSPNTTNQVEKAERQLGKVVKPSLQYVSQMQSGGF